MQLLTCEIRPTCCVFGKQLFFFSNDEFEQQLPESDPSCPSKSNLCSQPVALLPPEAMTAAIGSQKAFLNQVFI